MRLGFCIVIVCMIVALAVCAHLARRSFATKTIARDVHLLLVALIPPMFGNLVIIASDSQPIALIGCYLYYLGMDLTVCALLKFTYDYCHIDRRWASTFRLVSVPVAIDCAQLLLNQVFGHAFYTSSVLVDGAPYWAMTPLVGQHFHRIIAYGIFIASIVIFAYRMATAPRIYVERYAVILASMIAGGVWQTYYILSRTPIDRSMIGFGAFGFMIYFFALHYRPMRLLDRMLSRVVSDIPESVLFFDSDDTCIYANARAGEHMDVDVQGEAGLKRGTLILERCLEEYGVDTSAEWAFDSAVPSKDGEVRYLSMSFFPLRDAHGVKEGSFLSIRDRTDEELKLQREQYLARHDHLTGLYTQEQLFAAARELIDAHPDETFCVVGEDVKEFKLVNDVYGREVGDEVLRSIAQAIRSHASPHMVFGRLSGDKFGFVLPASEFEPRAVVNDAAWFDFGKLGVNYPIVVHMGVYEVTERDLPVSVMFDRAFMALRTIKSDYQRRYAYYDDSLRDSVLWSQKISAELEDALATGQIRPFLQPMVNAAGEVEGAEVLVRWIHPEEGFLSPARFIPYFEENGMIAKLDVYMWESACKILKSWEAQGIDLFLSVNISPKDFFFLDVASTITELVRRYDVRPEKLRLEITETVMMSDVENRLRFIDQLRELGHLVEMDDFGSGYSSLNMLKDMPVDVLKIDMTFLYKARDEDKANTILRSIIDLTRRLGIPSVTEGVETVEQRDMLVDMGCRLFQGYYYAKPMPTEDFEGRYLRA